MNTDERIKQHIETSTSLLRAPDRLEEVMAEGRRRRVRTGMATVLGTAALLAAVVTVGSALITRDGSPSATSPPASSLAATTVPPVTAPPATAGTADPGVVPTTPLGAIVADGEGITVLDTSGETVLRLTSDPAYAEISAAYPDQLGGVIYQHAVTPLPWEEGSLLRLPAGSDRPELLVAAPSDGRIVPVGPGMTSSGRPLFFFLEDRAGAEGSVVRLMMIDLTNGQTSAVTDVGSMDVTAGGKLAALVDRGGDCPNLTLFDAESGDVISALSEECLPTAAGVAVAHDGGSIAILNGGHFRVVTVDGGEVILERQIPEAYMATAGPGGWAVRTPDETLLLGTGGEEWSLPAVDAGWIIPYGRPLDLADGAALSLGASAETPCQPADVELPHQELPEAVAQARQTLFDLATACDYAGLADIAQSDSTSLTFGGGGDDPVALWVAEGRQATEPLALLARLLTTTPAEDPESGLWA
ncbi:MAG TPA: hypothetical protein VHL52_11410, partial [Acidimicrobiia bacterium]|nr:hypothetical protein [Acidimicrobiia bacterium]